MTPSTLCNALLSALENAVSSARSGFTLLHAPDFRGNEWPYVKECIDTAWVSSVGKYVDQFEKSLSDYTGARHAIAVSNGTSALFVALHMAGVQRDDEVIVPSLSFVATANAVAHCGAVPHFVDSALDTLGIDPQVLRDYLAGIIEQRAGQPVNRLTGRRIGALVPMHTFGFPVDLDPLLALSAEWGIPIVEDAAESLGSFYKGKHTGTFGRVGVLSFNGNKTITTGGGGAILTDDTELARAIKHVTTTGKVPHKWEFFHDIVAWNFRLPNLNAALGCAQMERLPEIIELKRALADRYRRALAGVAGLSFIDEPANTRSNFWLNAIRIEDADLETRDALLQAANDAGYQCRPIWRLLSSLPMYQNCPKAPLPVAEALEKSVINVPSSSYL